MGLVVAHVKRPLSRWLRTDMHLAEESPLLLMAAYAPDVIAVVLVGLGLGYAGARLSVKPAWVAIAAFVGGLLSVVLDEPEPKQLLSQWMVWAFVVPAFASLVLFRHRGSDNAG